MSLKEPTFLISTFFPLPIEIFASHLREPSKLVLHTFKCSSIEVILFKNVLTSLGSVKSGSVTISTNATPALL